MRYTPSYRVSPELTAHLHSGISIGAVPDIWTSCIERFFDTKPFSNSEIHYLLPQEVTESLPVNGSTKGGVVLPGGVVATEGREEDVAEVSSRPLWTLSAVAVPTGPDFAETFGLADSFNVGSTASASLHLDPATLHHRPSLRRQFHRSFHRLYSRSYPLFHCCSLHNTP